MSIRDREITRITCIDLLRKIRQLYRAKYSLNYVPSRWLLRGSSRLGDGYFYIGLFRIHLFEIGFNYNRLHSISWRTCLIVYIYTALLYWTDIVLGCSELTGFSTGSKERMLIRLIT